MNNSDQRAWPSDVDGDVFRRLGANEFDFSKEVHIDFNIDFDTWPPSPELMAVLESRFSNVEVYVPDPSGDGYVQITLCALLTYDLVMATQASLTALAAPYGGICESWGVLQD
jgi:hypothetical protein